MKRILSLLFAAILLLSLASCAPAKPAVDESLREGYDPNAGDDENPSDEEPDYHISDTLYIYMPRGYSAYGQEAVDQVNDILRREGFNLEFVMTDYVPLDLSMYYQGEIFEDFVIENISEGKGGIYLPPWETIWELEKDNLLGDFYSLGMSYAPNYTLRLCAPGEAKKLTYMTTYFKDYVPPILSVLVREDIAQEYEKEIRTVLIMSLCSIG